MKLKIFLARRISKRLQSEARFHRRALRDHQRHEMARIRSLETRSRGLRLYAAWAAKSSNVIRTQAEDWHQAAFASTPQEIDAKTPAAWIAE